jgi:hypothetical protein
MQAIKVNGKRIARYDSAVGHHWDGSKFTYFDVIMWNKTGTIFQTTADSSFDGWRKIEMFVAEHTITPRKAK